MSTYNLVVKYMEGRPSIKVEIQLGFLSYPLGQASEAMLFLSAANRGEKIINMSSQGFRIPNGCQLISAVPLSNVNFPYELLPRRRCQIWMETRKIAEQLKSAGFYGVVKLVGFYRDEVGDEYRSKAYKFNVDD